MEYKKISQAIAECKKNIEMSFDTFQEVLKEDIITNLSAETERQLQDYFVNEVREQGGIAITKDNVEDLFEGWLQNLTLQELNNILYA
jgi:DNA-directed RNA polymerase specialized sigma54-like protein